MTTGSKFSHKKIFEMVPRLSFYKTKAEQQNSESSESLKVHLCYGDYRSKLVPFEAHKYILHI